MNLLQVGVKLKAENIQSFIDDFLNIEGITISDIRLYKDLILINKIKYKSFGTIAIGLKFERVEDGVVSVIIKKLKAISIPISVITVNFILKMVLNKLNIPGITCDGKQIKINLPILFKEFNLNFVDLDIKDIQITEESINVIVGNIDVNVLEIMNNSKKQEDTKFSNVVLNNQINEMPSKIIDSISNNVKEESTEKQYKNKETTYDSRGFRKQDKGYFLEYSRVRSNLYENKFEKLNRDILGKIVFLLPDIGVLTYRLLRDKRVKKGVKAVICFTIAYLLNPIDIINKKFPILDKIDDGLLLIFALNKIFTSVDREILDYHFEGDEDTLDFLVDSFDVLNGLLGIDKVNKLYNVFEKFIR